MRVAHITTIDLSLRFLLLDQLQTLKAAGFDVTGISAPGPWVEDIEGAGIRHIPWTAASRSWGPWADAAALRELAGILRRERFDLVHTHNTKPGIMGRILARRLGVPAVVNTSHGLYVSPADRLRKKLPVLALERLAAAASDLELYQSAEDLRWARSIGLLGRTRAVLLASGIDVERFAPDQVSATRRREIRAELGIAEDALVVGTVARLVAKKGVREFFAMARALRKERRDVRFIAVGAPDPEKSDALSAAELSGEDVLITGWLPDARDLMAIMDVFVLASWWGEGKPRSAMEASALGKPVVVSDVRGCREVARHGVEGLVVPPRDSEALTAAVRQLLDDPELRERVGQAGRRRALAEFDRRPAFEVVVEEYRALAVRKGLMPSAREPIRTAEPGDAPALAKLHAQALPDAFLTKLGTGFLTHLYRAMAEDEECVCWLAVSDRAIVGFATGTTSMRRFMRRFIRRHGVPAGIASASRLLDPRVIHGIVEDLRYSSDHTELPEAEIVSVGIAAGHRNRGLARELVTRVVAELSKLGTPEPMVLVGAENRQANALYANIGFQPVGKMTLHRGAKSNIWQAQCRS